MLRPFSRGPATLVAAGLLAGCAATAIDDNVAAAQAEVHARAGVDFRWLASDAARAQAAADVAAALRQPLAEDDAARLALSYDPALQAALFEHAARSAEATQAARLPNPVFAFERLAAGGAPRELELTRSLTLPLAELLLWPAHLRAADAAQARTRRALAADVLRHADDARRAWIAAVADAQSARYAQRVVDAAEAGTELARRLETAGNFSALERAREESFAGEAATGLAQARRAARTSREALVRALGLDTAQAAQLTLPEHLPEIPAAEPAEDTAALQAALDDRLDLRLARAELDETARREGLAPVAGVVDGLALGAADKRQTGIAQERGVQLSVPLPVFDTGDAARAGARARVEAARQRVAAKAVAAASGLRGARGDLRDAWTLAHALRGQAVPLQAAITHETLLRYDGMLAGPFELLAEAREQARTVQRAIAAERDYWLAEAAWQAAVAGVPIPADDAVMETRQ